MESRGLIISILKIQILKKDDVKTEIAFLSHLIIPTAKNAMTLDEIGSINKLSIAHDIGDVFGLGYNIGYDYFGVGSGNLTYSLALGLSLSDKVSFYLEPYGALEELDYHYRNNKLYNKFCVKKGFEPSKFNGSLHDIPPVPVSVFKELGNDLNSVKSFLKAILLLN